MWTYSTIFLATLCLALAQEDSLSLDCKTKKTSNKKFYGNILTHAYIENEDVCVSLCWQYKTKGESCKSVNYQDSSKRCELMSDSETEPDESSGSLMSFPNVKYIEVYSCVTGNPKPTTPKPTRPPTAGPQPTQPPTASTIKSGTCGQSAVPNKASLAKRAHRIVGGQEARAHSMPWIVSLRMPLVNYHFCGGTLIRVNAAKDESDIVITAAHCLEGGGSTYTDVVAGAHYASIPSDGLQTARIKKIVIHPSYNSPVPSTNDIAIVKLAQPIKFNDNIQPACLPSFKEQVPDGTNGIVAGWGHTSEGGTASESLQQVVVPTINSEKCVSSYKRGQIVPETMLCAGFEQGQKDACQGDSGGPYILSGPNGYTLHGVVSWGNGCARARAPGVYARVSNYIDWIQTQIKILSDV